MFLNGKAVAAALSGALRERRPERRGTRISSSEGWPPTSKATPWSSWRPGRPSTRTGGAAVHITLTTHGLNDEALAATREDWWSSWSSQVDSPRLAIN